MNNKPPSSQKSGETVEEVLNILKGLTFKIEVKITDVCIVGPGQEEQREASQPSTKDPGSQDVPEEGSIAESIKLVCEPTIRLESTVPSRSKPAEPKVVEDVPEKSTDLPQASRDQRVPSARAPPIEARKLTDQREPRPTTVQNQTIPKEIEAPNPMFINNRLRLGRPRPVEPPAPVVPPQPVLIRGELALNSVLNTYCVSIDREEQPNLAYVIYNGDKIVQITTKVSELTDEIERLPPVATVRVGDMVIAKSKDDDIWYRSIVESVDRNMVKIFFYDWGVREQLDKERIKILTFPELSLQDHPACAVRLRIVDSSPELAEEFFKGENSFDLRIKAYDDFADYYEAVILCKKAQE